MNVSHNLTESLATLLAKRTRHRARCLRGNWIVWCDVSQHAVEFDQCEIDRARADVKRMEGER